MYEQISVSTTRHFETGLPVRPTLLPATAGLANGERGPSAC